MPVREDIKDHVCSHLIYDMMRVQGREMIREWGRKGKGIENQRGVKGEELVVCNVYLPASYVYIYSIYSTSDAEQCNTERCIHE